LIINSNRVNISALCELFEKADATGDGTISIEEYVLMCETYGIELTEEHIEEFRAIADSEGEVSGEVCIVQTSLQSMLACCQSAE
jgi:Ca2+-binding EF-hand superfamily protein